MSKNGNLHGAKRAKQDEFYTQWGDIEKEMQAYLEYDPDAFRDKVVLLPCDDPEESNFTKYFALNFEKFGLKKLISTSYALSRNPANEKRGRIYVLERGENVNEEDLKWDYLQGDGDFRSDEIKALRDEADMVITNPPFSLFREFVAWLIEGDVKFSIIGNMNAITYKEIFPLIKENKIWPGQVFNKTMGFAVPDGYFVKEGSEDRDSFGRNVVKVPAICWFTNIQHVRRNDPLPLMTMEQNLLYGSKRVREVAYPKYDNYDAIEVPEAKGIPSDYEGVMGVPISFLDKYNPEQFEIISGWNSGKTVPNPGAKVTEYFDKNGKSKSWNGPTVNKSTVYFRILIKHKTQTETNNIAA